MKRQYVLLVCLLIHLHCPYIHILSIYVYLYTYICCCSVAVLCPTLFMTPWTVACQDPLSMGIFRQEYWSELPFPPPGDLPDPGIEPASPALAGGLFTTEPPRKPYIYIYTHIHTHTHTYVYYIYNINVVFLEYESQKNYLKWKKLRPNRWTHSIYKFTLYITENRLRLDILRVMVLKVLYCDFPQARVAFTLIQNVIFCPQAKLVGRLLLWNSCEAGRRWLIYINASFNQEEGVRGQVGGVWVTKF